MRDRIVLISIILCIWLVLAFVHLLIPIDKILIVMILLVVYTIILNVTFTHQTRRQKKRPPRLDHDYQPGICVVIPAHNEETVIEKTVENMLKLDYHDYEIFIVDDRSEDNTAEVIKKLAEQYEGKIRFLIRDKNAYPGKSAVLNDVLALCEKDVMCVFDADARVKPDFLTQLLPFLAPEEIGAVQARKIIINKDENYLTRCQNNEYTLDNHFQLSRDSINGAVELRGNGFLVKKIALEEIGGWNPNTITDDLDLSTKLHLNAWGVRYCPVAEVYEEGILNFIPLIKQRRRWVEGSIRRYLDYMPQVLTSDSISLRASFDMVAYLLEFAIPVILVMQVIVQSFKFIKGMENQLFATFAFGFGIGLFFFLGLIFSLKRYDKLSWFQTVKQAIETSIYMFVIWLPLVTFILFKILLCKRDMHWGKTSHGLVKDSNKTGKQVTKNVEKAEMES